MSDPFFEREANILLSRQHSAVLFAHKKSAGQGEHFFLHLNNHVELYICLSGQTDYIVEDDYLSLKPGNVVVIRPHEVHVPVIRTAGVYERMYMLLPLDAFADLAFDPLPCYLAMKGHLLSLPPEKEKEFLKLLYQLSDLAAEKTDAGMKMAGLFLQSQGLLTGVQKNGEGEEALRSGIPRQLRNILQYIGLHVQEIDSVEALARHFYLSPQYLSTLFKKHVGVPVNQYLRIKKIALAKGYLEKGSSVSEACYECGFSDSSYFIKNFRQYVGMTPGQYRNMFRKK